MIEVLGEDGTSEHAAALAIRDALVKLWPEVATSEADTVKLVTGAKISGYRVSDIDIVMCASFRPGRRFLPRRVLADMDGGRVANQPVEVPNLVAAIEVKDHDASGVRITGDTIEVKYSRQGPIEWKSATEQNISQLHALKGYLADQQMPVFVHRLVIMRGLGQLKVNGALPRVFSGAEFFTEIAAVSRLAKRGGGFQLGSAPPEVMARALASPFFKRLAPTSLDRKRMDRIATRRSAALEWQSLMGSKMLRFRGRGGSGKTVLLLEMAWRAFEQKAARTLVLTYNQALAADIRRLMALLGVPAAPDSGGIAVDTVMSFMFHLFEGLGLLEGDEDNFLERYGEHCATASELFSTGAVAGPDIQGLVKSEPDRFDFDYVVVDEAQDWPAAELAVLKAFFGPERILLADGVDQLVRGARANWDHGVAAGERMVIPLVRCLRMKANLAVFANTVAECAGLNWHVEPNDEAGGGRVILVDGAYADQHNLHADLINAAKAAGNAEVDLLFCVPPSDVQTAGERSSGLGRAFESRGLSVWDGTNPAKRRDFPRSADSLRVVQYASCRGLEGWTVVADGLDECWTYRMQERLDAGAAPGGDVELGTLRQAACDEAWRWCLIPLTRPIDTLVICVRDAGSELGQVLAKAAARLPDVVERFSPGTAST